MQVYLLRSEEFKEEEYNEVVEFLQSFDGPVNFIKAGSPYEIDPSSLNIEATDHATFFKQEPYACMEISCESIPNERLEVDAKELFAICREFRNERKIGKQDFVLLLTEVANDHNWFCAIDPGFSANGFVHTAEWQHYLFCSKTFPVAYLIASLILQKKMFGSLAALQNALHQFPLGCVNDFCENKKEIILKLRTADICEACMNKLLNKIDPLELQQLLNIFEGVRLRILFNQHFRKNLKPSPLVITKGNKIILPAYGNLEVKMTPLEKTIFLFFLEHPGGVMLHDLVDHKSELRTIYAGISTSGLLAEIHSRIDGLADVNSNSASEKISKIKAAFVKAVGAELAKHYYIQGQHNDKKYIALDRTLYCNQYQDLQ